MSFTSPDKCFSKIIISLRHDYFFHSIVHAHVTLVHCQKCPIHAQSPAGSTTPSSCVCKFKRLNPDL